LPIRIVGAIGRSAAMAPDLPAHCRRRPGRGRWLSHGSMSRKRFLAKCPRALSKGALDQSAGGGGAWSNPSARQQHTANAVMGLPQARPISCNDSPPSIASRHQFSAQQIVSTASLRS
jgi:hypothetical protein